MNHSLLISNQQRFKAITQFRLGYIRRMEPERREALQELLDEYLQKIKAELRRRTEQVR